MWSLLRREAMSRPAIGPLKLPLRFLHIEFSWNLQKAPLIQDPDGVKQLAKEFARAGADVTQTFTFYSTDDWVGGKLGSSRHVFLTVFCDRLALLRRTMLQN